MFNLCFTRCTAGRFWFIVSAQIAFFIFYRLLFFYHWALSMHGTMQVLHMSQCGFLYLHFNEDT